MSPEDDDELRRDHDLEARRGALSAIEKRCHLLFRQVEQLLRWCGDEVAVSARAAVLGDEEQAETHRAVRE